MKELQKSLLKSVGDRIAQYGFDSTPKGQSFQRSHDWGKDSLHLTFIEHDDDFDVTADVAIRFNELEELVNKNNKFLSAKEKKGTFSMGAELGNIVDRKPQRWTVRTHEDIEEIANQIVSRFVEIGIPYIDRYSDPSEAFAALSSDSPDAWIHSPIHGERAKRAVGLAWLLYDEEKVRDTVEAKTKFLTEQNDYALSDVRAFVDSLPQ